MATEPVERESMLVTWREPEAGLTVYKLTITDADIAAAKLDEFDRAVIADCAKTGRPVSDTLLGLETLVRRIEEAKRKARTRSGR